MTYRIILDYCLTEATKTRDPVVYFTWNTDIIEAEEVVLFMLKE